VFVTRLSSSNDSETPPLHTNLVGSDPRAVQRMFEDHGLPASKPVFVERLEKGPVLCACLTSLTKSPDGIPPYEPFSARPPASDPRARGRIDLIPIPLDQIVACRKVPMKS